MEAEVLYGYVFLYSVTCEKYQSEAQLDTFNKFLLKKSTNKQQEIQKKICRAKLLMYSILHYITNCLYFHIISTTKKYI